MTTERHLRDLAPVAPTATERRRVDRARARLDHEREASTDDYMTQTMLAPLSRDERGLEKVYAGSSIRNSGATLAGALAVRCEEHDADPGSPCWGSPLSGVRGFCMSRYERGIAAPVRRSEPFDPTAVPDRLAVLAQATRNARRDARIREREAAAALRRHPNRHPSPHTRAEAQR